MGQIEHTIKSKEDIRTTIATWRTKAHITNLRNMLDRKPVITIEEKDTKS